MQSVHVSAFMIRNLKGHYVKSDNDEGFGYVVFRTKAKAKQWSIERGITDCYVVKVRAAITPTYTGRVERLVAVQAARPATVPKKVHHNFFP